eukprot:SAG31_NODE_1968_length_6780_cov_1.940129_1_plen_528_part_00
MHAALPLGLLLFGSLECVTGKDKCERLCPGSNASWDLDDGPCWDYRDQKLMLTAYELALERAEEFYAYSEWKRVDWANVRTSGLANAKMADQTGDPSYLHLAVTQLVASIPDGHVQLEYPDDNPDKDVCGPKAHSTAARLKHEHIGGGFGLTISGLDSGEVIITSVVPGSQAGEAGLQAGDVVQLIDGVDSVTRVKAQGAAGWMWVSQCCSNPATKSNQLMEQFRAIARGPVGAVRTWTINNKTTSIKATDDSYLTWNATLPRSPWFYFPTDSPNPPPHDGKKPEPHYRMIGDIGYIGIGEEEVPKLAEKMASALASFKAAKGVILDIRGNDGGDDPQGPKILDFFLPQDAQKVLYERASYSNRLLSVASNGKFRRYMNGTSLDNYAIIPDQTLYWKPVDLAKLKKKIPKFEGPFTTGPVVVMVNSYCDSTCEGVAMGFLKLQEWYPHRDVAVSGFDGTLGSFGMDGGTVVLPGNITFEFPFGRSLGVDDRIQLDSDWTGAGGVLPTKRLVRNSSDTIMFAQQGLLS